MQMPLVLTNRRRRGGSASAPAFSPSTLFSSTAIGIWLDPSDLTTMFSDRAGTTPVTTPGTVVGLRLDKSKGLVLGSELVVNGDFSNGLTGWIAVSGITAVDNAANLSAVAVGSSSFYRPLGFAPVAGKVYQVSFTISNYASGAVSFRIDGQNKTSRSSNGTFTQLHVGVAASSNVGIAIESTATLTIDNISVRELAGNHAVAPTDAARPIYGVEPKGGRRNLLTYSEEITNAAWVKIGSTVPSTQYLAPDGTTTADLLLPDTASSQHYMNAPSPTSVLGAHVISYYVKANGANFVQIAFGSSSNPNNARVNYDLAGKVVGTTTAGLTGSIVELSDGWFRIACVVDIDASPVSHSVALISSATDARLPVFTGDGTSGILIWGAQLELGSTATNYQRVLSAYDITESGVATTHYVQYDGSDDSMSTAAIDFTATDKMSVFAGVRKLSDAAAGIIVEHSANATSNNGVFNLYTFTTPSNVFTSKGTIAREPLASSAPAPLSIIMTGLGDISGDLATLRINGAQVAQSTADQGTGNFGNYPLFIGRRNNATIPFNGKDYGIIIVGKAASSTEITDTETWLAAKTAQVTI